MQSRPTTSNPKRRLTQNSPIHHQPSLMSPRAGNPSNNEDLTAEVLWSEEHGVPPAILARPHTSNPRYVEMNLRDTPRKESQAGAGSTTGSAGATSTPLLASRSPSEGSPEAHQVASSNIEAAAKSQQQQAASSCGVLWASDSVSIDPAIIARPITANPWLRRLFESGVLPEDNWSKKQSQILWSSIDVEDWRMLARPHASNPLLQRGIEDDSTMVESSPTVTHNLSEVLWQRDETAEGEGNDTSNPTSERNENNPIAVPNSTENREPSISSQFARALLETIKSQSEQMQRLQEEVHQLRDVVAELSSTMRNQQNHWTLTRGFGTSAGPSASAAPPSNSQLHQSLGSIGDSQTLDVSVDQSKRDVAPLRQLESPTSALSGQAIMCGVASPGMPSYMPDPSVSTVPLPKEEYPQFYAPSPPRDAPRSTPTLTPPPHQHVSHISGIDSEKPLRLGPVAGSDADYETFVKEDNSVIEPQLEGLVLPSSSPMTAQQQRPETANSRHVLQLRETVGSSRPQSAPLQSYNDRSGGGHAMKKTMCFSKDGSDAMLLNNKAIQEQYEKLIKPGNPFALKSDFKAMYQKKSEEFGMCVSTREIDRKLQSFHSVGKDYLSFEEFSVLYLHIAQW